MADAIDFTELARRFRKAAAGLPAFGKKLGRSMGNNATDDIKDRIIQRGEGADGKPLRRPETSGGLPGFGQGETDDYSPKYKAKKIKAGRYRGHIDLQFTTRMWSSTGIVERKVEGKSDFLVIIAAKNKENQDKLDWNSDRYGNVLELSPGEVETLRVDYIAEVDLYIAGHLEGN